MMWESPINSMIKDLISKYENGVITAVQKVGITVDKDELIKALEYDRGQYEKGYKDGYNDGYNDARKEIDDTWQI